MPAIARFRCRPARRVALPAAAVLAAATCAGVTLMARAPGPDPRGLTAVEGLKVGSITLSERPTGCTVILVDGEGAVGGVAQRGGAPGTRETDLLNPANMVDKVNAIVLSGGSAFGLDAASGTVRWLEEHDIGLGRAHRQGADRARGHPVRPAGRQQAEDPAHRRMRLPGGGRGHERQGGGGLGRRRRRRHRRQVGRRQPLDEGRARQLRHHPAERPDRGGNRGGQRRRRHHRSRHRRGRRRRAQCRTAPSPTRAVLLRTGAPLAAAARRARTRPSAWSRPTPG